MTRAYVTVVGFMGTALTQQNVPDILWAGILWDGVGPSVQDAGQTSEFPTTTVSIEDDQRDIEQKVIESVRLRHPEIAKKDIILI